MVEYELVDAANDTKVYQRGCMWVVEDNDGRLASGKTRNEAVYNMLEFLRKEKLFNQQ